MQKRPKLFISIPFTSLSLESVSPVSLRSDPKSIAEVAYRLAELTINDGATSVAIWHTRGKKSRSVSAGTDSIKKIVDWPYCHLREGGKGAIPDFESH